MSWSARQFVCPPHFDVLTPLRQNTWYCFMFLLRGRKRRLSCRWETWWRHQMEILSALLSLCTGNSLVTGEFPTQRPVTRSFDVSLICALNKRLREQSWGWWFEMPSRSLWRRCNVSVYQLDVLPFSDVLNMFPFPLTARISPASAGVKQMSDDILEARNLILRPKYNTSASTRWGLLTHTWASCQIRKIAVCTCAGNAGNVFPATDFKGNC